MHKVEFEPKVALVYDWLDTEYGGAEKVLLALHEAFPKASLFTSVATKKTGNTWWKNISVKSSFLQKWPFLGSKPRWLLPLLPLAFESFDFSDFDIVISVTSGPAKGVQTKPEQLHICYLLTPPRYLYSHRDEYLRTASQWLPIRWVINLVLRYITWWDQVSASRPDKMIAISNLIAKRAEIYYGRHCDGVLYPPVESFPSQPSDSLRTIFPTWPEEYALVVSRLVSYKRIDLAVQACQQIGLPLVIIGEGEERQALEVLAGSDSNIHFVGAQPQSVVTEALTHARVVLMPGIEDFGIAAAEAVASGKPVIVHRDSGVAEILTESQAAIFLDELTVSNLVSALKNRH